MNTRYRLHPDDCDVGETEQLYASMAAKGWLLDKRGGWFSRFRRGEPQTLRYRLEFSSPSPEEALPKLPPDQVAVYEDAGWSLVAVHGSVNVFCAPEDSRIPELHTDPVQQAETLKYLRKSARDALISLPIRLAGWLVLLFLNAGGMQRGLSYIPMSWYICTALLLSFSAFMLSSLLSCLYRFFTLRALCRSLEAGISIDHSPRRRFPLRRSICGILMVAALVFGVVGVAEYFARGHYIPPNVPEGPALTLSDLGWDGQPYEMLGRGSEITVIHSLLADYWDGREYMDTGGDSLALFQDVLRLHNPETAMNLAPALMRWSAFVRPDEWVPYAHPGFDAVYVAPDEPGEVVVVKGNIVSRFSYIYPDQFSETGDKLAERNHLLDTYARLLSAR